MCRPATCNQCGKPTYVGCGMHVEQVLGHVPPAQRCRCHEQPAKSDKSQRR
ncbi:MAG TPA: hypothetical protein VF997_24935 [Polyangia bacterium]